MRIRKSAPLFFAWLLSGFLTSNIEFYQRDYGCLEGHNVIDKPW